MWKHCQRHNGPEGWVLLTKVTSLGHITSSNTNLDQTSSESRPCINFKISIKHHHFDKTKPESRPTMNLIAKIKHQQQNNDQTSASKSWTNLETLSSNSEQKLNFMTKVHLPQLHQTVVDTFLIIDLNNSNNFNKFWVAIFTCQSHINQVY